MSDTDWTANDIGDQQGRTVLVTGANSGIGLETAKSLAGHGASVVLACRDLGRGREAARRIENEVPGATVSTLRLDLASLASVREAVEQVRSEQPGLDLLINNAGVMMPPLTRTEDGFELQFGTNHLGHFVLTGLLLDRLLATPGSRVVTVSSIAHRRGRIDLDDLNWQRRPYRRLAAYGQSKLANLLFIYELQRRLAAAGAGTIAVAAHPGVAHTELSRYAGGAMRFASLFVMRMLAQPDAATAALPSLRAATGPDVRGGDFYGPDGPLHMSGHPVLTEPSARAHDVEMQRRLWAASERLTGVTYPLEGAG